MTFKHFSYTQPLIYFHFTTDNLSAALENNMSEPMNFLIFPMLHENKLLLLCYFYERTTGLKNSRVISVNLF